MGCASSTSSAPAKYKFKPIKDTYEMGWFSSSKKSSKNAAAMHKFQTIRDRYECIEEVQRDLRARGLESSDMLCFIDYTKSNDWSGEKTHTGRSLHELQSGCNPYQQVISIVAKTLATFDDDQLIPTYGFGDVQTRGEGLFSFLPNDQPIHTFGNVLTTYSNLTPHVSLSGPTNLAPAILKSIDTVIQSNHAYHIALIIADGQVSEQCMKQTVDAIVLASHYALSLLVVGVGDGPFDLMEKFDDELPTRVFDNLQFVNFSAIMNRCAAGGFSPQKAEAAFSLAALQEVPAQYAAIKKLRLLGPQSAPPPRPAPVVVYSPPRPSTQGQGQW